MVPGNATNVGNNKEKSMSLQATWLHEKITFDQLELVIYVDNHMKKWMEINATNLKNQCEKSDNEPNKFIAFKSWSCEYCNEPAVKNEGKLQTSM